MGLQLGERGGSQRWERLGQTTVLIVVGLVLVAGLLGLFGGPGPLSTASVVDADGHLAVAYQRFVHRGADESVSIRVDAAVATGESVDIELDAAWLEELDVRGVSPEPAEQIRAGDAVVFRMPVQPGSGLTVEISFRPVGAGALDGWVQAGTAAVAFGQFSYP